MENRFVHLEFGVACVADIRFLLKAWQRLLVLEGIDSSESSLVHVIAEDRRPGEEVKLCFMVAQEVLSKFLQSLKDQGLKFTRDDLLPGILILCRVTRDHGPVEVISFRNGGE